MTENSSSFSSGLRLSQKMDYGCGAIGTLILAIFPVWIVVMFVRNSEVRSSEIPGLVFFLFSAVVLLVPSFIFWVAIFRERLTIYEKGVIYQSAFNRTMLLWNDIEGFATMGNTLYLVYNSSKLPLRPRWVKSKPLIPLSKFTNEWPPKGKPRGPLMSAIFRHAPHLYGREKEVTINQSGAQQDAK